jgi:hypothetical protein
MLTGVRPTPFPFDFTLVNSVNVSEIGDFMDQENRGPVWPIIVLIIAIYLLAALVDPCDGGCSYDEVQHGQR